MTWDVTQTTTVARYTMSQKSRESLDRLHAAIAAVRLTEPGDMDAFRRWQTEDGTLEGLARLPARGEQPFRVIRDPAEIRRVHWGF